MPRRSIVRGVLALLIGSALVMLAPPARQAHAQGGVIQLDDSVIKGRIQKPEAFYILQHANLNYETLDLKPSFLEELRETVEAEPFQ